MNLNEYEYDYHKLVAESDYIDENYYHDSNNDEPWMDEEDSEDYEDSENTNWDNYYHNLTNEIDDE